MEGYMELIDTLPSFTGADFDRLSRLSNNAEGPSISICAFLILVGYRKRLALSSPVGRPFNQVSIHVKPLSQRKQHARPAYASSRFDRPQSGSVALISRLHL